MRPNLFYNRKMREVSALCAANPIRKSYSQRDRQMALSQNILECNTMNAKETNAGNLTIELTSARLTAWQMYSQQVRITVSGLEDLGALV
jgi:hypothetical protein